MNKKNIGIIDYISGWEFQEDGSLKPVKVGTEHQEILVLDHTKRFHNCLYLLAGLNPCARNLMDWLAEEMNENNIVYHTADSRKSFNVFLGKITNGKVSYADQTIKQAWSSLNQAGLIIAKSTKATFIVNPKYFWNGKEDERIGKIVAQITFDNKGIDNFKIFKNKKLGI